VRPSWSTAGWWCGGRSRFSTWPPRYETPGRRLGHSTRTIDLIEDVERLYLKNFPSRRNRKLCQTLDVVACVATGRARRAEGQIVRRELAIARRDPPTLFDLIEEPFDQVAGSVQMRAEADRLVAIASRRYIGPSMPCLLFRVMQAPC